MQQEKTLQESSPKDGGFSNGDLNIEYTMGSNPKKNTLTLTKKYQKSKNLR